MRTVLGLSLTSSDVSWALVKGDCEGTVLDYDAIEVLADGQITDAAARGAAAIATASGHKVDGVRVTWSRDVRADGKRLLHILRRLGFDDVVAVRRSNAIARAGVSPAAEPWSLARGAALENYPAARRPRRRIASVLIGAAAAIAITLVASSGAPRAVEHDHATKGITAAVGAVTPSESGDVPAMIAAGPSAPLNWVAVDPAPPASRAVSQPASVDVAAPVLSAASAGSSTRLPDQPHLAGAEASAVQPVVTDQEPALPAPRAPLPGPDPDSMAQFVGPIVAALP